MYFMYTIYGYYGGVSYSLKFVEIKRKIQYSPTHEKSTNRH